MPGFWGSNTCMKCPQRGRTRQTHQKMDFFISHSTHHFHALDVGCWSMWSQHIPPTSLSPTEKARWGRTGVPNDLSWPVLALTGHLSAGQMTCPGPVRGQVTCPDLSAGPVRIFLRTGHLSGTCPRHLSAVFDTLFLTGHLSGPVRGTCPHFFADRSPVWDLSAAPVRCF